MYILKEQSEFLVNLKAAGSAAATVGFNDYYVIPFACKLGRIFLRFSTTGTKPGDATLNVQLDILKNGVTALTTKPEWTGASQGPTINAVFSPDPPTFVKGDVLQIDVTQIFNGTGPTQPTDFDGQFVLVRLGTPPAAVTVGSIIIGE